MVFLLETILETQNNCRKTDFIRNQKAVTNVDEWTSKIDGKKTKKHVYTIFFFLLLFLGRWGNCNVIRDKMNLKTKKRDINFITQSKVVSVLKSKGAVEFVKQFEQIEA